MAAFSRGCETMAKRLSLMDRQMDRFETIRELISNSSLIAEFADYGVGIDTSWIIRAEEAIGMRLPKSYRWWLENYSGGEIGGEEIYSIYGEDFDSVTGDDVVAMYRIYQGQPNANVNRIPNCHSDVDGVFRFDASLPAEYGEYAILSEATGRQYAADFLELLEKRINVFTTSS